MMVKASDFEWLRQINPDSLIIRAMIDDRDSVMIGLVRDDRVRDLIERGFIVSKLISDEKHVGYKVRWGN